MKIRSIWMIRIPILFLILALTGMFGWTDTLAQTGGDIYFPETGHRITGEFFTAFQAAEEPLLLYGYPITEAFTEPQTGRVVQYFQKTRFELYPEQPQGENVRISPLGSYLYTPGEPLPVPVGGAACRSFEETEYTVCHAFLEFFDQYGGVEQFGPPISGFESQDARIVQYFERARFEWRPERPAGQRVILTNLGTRYFELLQENRNRLNPISSDNLVATVLELKASVFTVSPVTGLAGEQTVFVVVRDQNNRFLSNAQVDLVVSFPDGSQVSHPMASTNSVGITQAKFSYRMDDVGTVRLVARVRYQALVTQQEASFRTWW